MTQLPRWTSAIAFLFAAALGTTVTGALPSSAHAAPIDCAFFAEQAREKQPIDYSVRMLEACEALAAYRDRVLAENVRYAFGEQAAANPERVAERSAPLDTFQVLPEMRRYLLAREIGVFGIIRELPTR
ncbi:MAG: hypothetical protein AAGF76_08675 [Pseudomonadota bacterium]